MLRPLTFLLALALVAGCASPASSPPPSTTPVASTPASSGGETPGGPLALLRAGDLPGGGRYYVVQNVADGNVSITRARLVGEGAAEVEGLASRTFLAPGQTSALVFPMGPDLTTRAWRLAPEVDEASPSNPGEGLRIASMSLLARADGFYHLVGQMGNDRDAPVLARVRAVVYDADGDVLLVASAPTTPAWVLPGATATFDLPAGAIASRPAWADATLVAGA